MSRELDALVAEKVFGWKWVRVSEVVAPGETRKMYVQSRAVADCLPRAMCEAALQAVTQPLMERVDE